MHLQFQKFLFPAFVLLLLSCSTVPEKTEPEKAVFVETIQPEFAKGFEIFRYEDHDKVIIREPISGRILQEFTLANDPSSQVPVDFSFPGRWSCLSTTHAAMISAAGLEENIVGLAYADRIMDEKLIALLEDGSITDLSGEKEVDDEKLLRTNSDVFFIYPYDMDAAMKYEELGVPLVQVTEYMEPHPLGRAEWIRFFGFLAGEQAESDAIFEQIRTEYLQLKTEAMYYSFIPSVLTGSFYQGKWFAPGGESMVAQFIKDAAGQYVFYDTKGVENITLEMETLLEKAHNADYWGKVVYADSLPPASDFVEDDERLKALKAFREGKLFICNAQTTDYFGAGVVEPQVILKDMINILHPGAHPGYEPKYFKAYN